jgi:alpha-tubulin suppressor-like RCC1 family protein
LVPVVINVGEAAISVAVGESHVCVLLDMNGYVSCWGVNDFIVDLPIENASQPTHIGDLAPALSIISGQQHMCAMHEGSAVSCWGTNINGQLGNGGKLSSSTPTPVVGLP